MKTHALYFFTHCVYLWRCIFCFAFVHHVCYCPWTNSLHFQANVPLIYFCTAQYLKQSFSIYPLWTALQFLACSTCSEHQLFSEVQYFMAHQFENILQHSVDCYFCIFMGLVSEQLIIQLLGEGCNSAISFQHLKACVTAIFAILNARTRVAADALHIMSRIQMGIRSLLPSSTFFIFNERTKTYRQRNVRYIQCLISSLEC